MNKLWFIITHYLWIHFHPLAKKKHPCSFHVGVTLWQSVELNKFGDFFMLYNSDMLCFSSASMSLSSKRSIICSSGLSCSVISGDTPLALSSSAILFLNFFANKVYLSRTALLFPSQFLNSSLAFSLSVMSSHIFPLSRVEDLYW